MPRLLLPVVLLSLAFAPAPFPKPGRGLSAGERDLKALQGEWELVRSSINGGEFYKPGEIRMTVSGNSKGLSVRGGTPVRWTITLDATGRPRRCDMLCQSGRKVYAIYRLDGDIWTACWCTNDEPRDRPTEFRTGDGFGLHEYRRVKR